MLVLGDLLASLLFHIAHPTTPLLCEFIPRRDHTAILARLCSLAKVIFDLMVATQAWRTKLGVVSPIGAAGYLRLPAPGGLELPAKPAESDHSAWSTGA